MGDIPVRYDHANFKLCDVVTFDHCAQIEIGKRPIKGILYTGGAGTGKSYAMWCVAKSARKTVDEHTRVTVIKFRSLIELFHEASFSRANYTPAELIDALTENSYLFIDDMTIRVKSQSPESPYRWSYECMNALADAWWDSGKGGGLYITTNNTPAELADAFGTPLMDRIRSMCDKVEITGASRR